MVRYRFLTVAAVALGAYGVLGLIIAVAMLVVGFSTFGQVTSLQQTLESERGSLVQSIRTVSATLHDTAGATTGFQQSIDRARAAADQASRLANSSAGTFRGLGTSVSGVTVLGIQPLAGLGPQFSSSADQLQQLAIQLGATRDALAQNGTDVQQVGNDLNQLQQQLDTVAAALSQPGVLGLDAQSLLPFQVAFYGMCLLVLLQSAFSIVAGVVLYRLSRALGGEPLFPHIAPIKRATTIDAAAPDHVQVS
ncbi:MAG: hypothetical protein JO352_37280 [Chloroflexi bacterium]|nr:hypothetical protein [Chloroflexota bacterium]MBV9598050.1 hypothetical protein [Chloroflexota bacterium]